MALSDSQMLEGIGRDKLSKISSVPEKILAVKECIDVEFLTIESVPELAERFHYNREHLSRSFNKYFSISVYGYVLRRRLMYARGLMLTGEQTMVAARKAGFNNYASFSERFHKQFGCTPSEYKNSLLTIRSTSC